MVFHITSLYDSVKSTFTGSAANIFIGNMFSLSLILSIGVIIFIYVFVQPDFDSVIYAKILLGLFICILALIAAHDSIIVKNVKNSFTGMTEKVSTLLYQPNPDTYREEEDREKVGRGRDNDDATSVYSREYLKF